MLLAARTKLPLAATVVPIQEHATLSLRALVTQARTNLARHARLHKVGFDTGFWDGVARWWPQPQRLVFGVPAKENLAVTVDAQAQAAAGAELTVGRRGHTVRPGQGRAARTERLESAVVGMTWLTTDDQCGTPEHGRHRDRGVGHTPPCHSCGTGTGRRAVPYRPRAQGGGPKAAPVKGQSPVAGGALLGVLAVEAYPGMRKPALASLVSRRRRSRSGRVATAKASRRFVGDGGD